MTTIVDANVLVAAGDPRDRDHDLASRWLGTTEDRLVIPQAVACEVDHLLLHRGLDHARHAFLRDVAAGRLETYCLDTAAWAVLATLADRYSDLAPGLSDLSVVVAADRHETTRVATFDDRHFRTLTSLDGTPFQLEPRDG